MATEATTEKVYKSRVAKQYAEEVVPYLTKKFGYTNVMQVPKLVKIVINTGLGDIKDNAKSIQTTQNEIKQITAEKAVDDIDLTVAGIEMLVSAEQFAKVESSI